MALPLTTDAHCLYTYFARLDGLVLAGGEDIEPWRYGLTDRARRRSGRLPDPPADR